MRGSLSNEGLGTPVGWNWSFIESLSKAHTQRKQQRQSDQNACSLLRREKNDQRRMPPPFRPRSHTASTNLRKLGCVAGCGALPLTQLPIRSIMKKQRASLRWIRLVSKTVMGCKDPGISTMKTYTHTPSSNKNDNASLKKKQSTRGERESCRSRLVVFKISVIPR